MAHLSDSVLDQLAALFVFGAPVVRARAGALPPPPDTGDANDWRDWIASLGDEPLADLLARLPPNAAFTAAIAMLRAAPLPASTAHAPHILLRIRTGEGIPSVDRSDIWQNLQSLKTGTRRILQIRGKSRTGKTHLKFMVRELCNSLGLGHDFRYQDLDGVRSLFHIANTIVTKLGQQPQLNKYDEADSTPNAWARDLADDVFAIITKTRERTPWLVFDHFERAKRPEAIIFFSHFAEQVALAASDPNMSNGPRLVLIDHGVELTPVARLLALDAEVSVVAQSDVERFLASCNVPGLDVPAEASAIYTSARDEANNAMEREKEQDPGAPPVDRLMEVLGRKLTDFVLSRVVAGGAS